MRNATLPAEPILHPRARDAELLADEAKYCSFGDTVHYSDPPKIFDRCEGSYLYDAIGTPFLDLQMWYSAVNFGYAQSVEDSLKLVRNASGGKSLMFAFEGGYHGRTLGASAITSSYRYRRQYGH